MATLWATTTSIQHGEFLTLLLSLPGGMQQDRGMPQQPQHQLQQQVEPIEMMVPKHLRQLDSVLKQFQVRKFGVRPTIYTVPVKPTAGAVDRKRLRLVGCVKKVHITVEQTRALIIVLRRQIHEVQESKFVYQSIKVRHEFWVQEEGDGKKERAAAANQAHSRVRSVSTTNPLDLASARTSAAADDDGLDFSDFADPDLR
jgi:hypothetical protein